MVGPVHGSQFRQSPSPVRARWRNLGCPAGHGWVPGDPGKADDSEQKVVGRPVDDGSRLTCDAGLFHVISWGASPFCTARRMSSTPLSILSSRSSSLPMVCALQEMRLVPVFCSGSGLAYTVTAWLGFFPWPDHVHSWPRRVQLLQCGRSRPHLIFLARQGSHTSQMLVRFDPTAIFFYAWIKSNHYQDSPCSCCP